MKYHHRCCATDRSHQFAACAIFTVAARYELSRYLCWVDDAGFHHVDKLIAPGVIAVFALHDARDDVLRVDAAVVSDRVARNAQRPLHDVDT